jgi:predicted nucleotidyltransferase
MDKIIKKNLSKIKEIAKNYDLRVLILFGSRTSNNYDISSDYDFAYFASKPLEVNKKIELLERLQEIVNFEQVDLIELNTTHSILLRKEIFNETGICLYEAKEGLFDDLAGSAWIDYMDNKSYFDEYDEILAKSISEL